MTSLCWNSYLILKHSLTSLSCNPNVITVSFVREQHPIINKYGYLYAGSFSKLLKITTKTDKFYSSSIYDAQK